MILVIALVVTAPIGLAILVRTILGGVSPLGNVELMRADEFAVPFDDACVNRIRAPPTTHPPGT